MKLTHSTYNWLVDWYRSITMIRVKCRHCKKHFYVDEEADKYCCSIQCAMGVDAELLINSTNTHK